MPQWPTAQPDRPAYHVVFDLGVLFGKPRLACRITGVLCFRHAKRSTGSVGRRGLGSKGFWPVVIFTLMPCWTKGLTTGHLARMNCATGQNVGINGENVRHAKDRTCLRPGLVMRSTPSRCWGAFACQCYPPQLVSCTGFAL